MKSNRNFSKLGLLAVLSLTALVCGCPPNTELNAAVRTDVVGHEPCVPIKLGSWAFFFYDPEGRLVFFPGLKLKADGSMYLQFQPDEPAGYWEQDCGTFAFWGSGFSFAGVVESDTRVEGTYTSSDSAAEWYTVIMKFVSEGEPPSPLPGHWRFTFTQDGYEYNVGLKLNADGTAEPSSVGDYVLNGEIGWDSELGVLDVTADAIYFTAQMVSARTAEGLFQFRPSESSEMGYCIAHFVPVLDDGSVLDDPMPF